MGRTCPVCGRGTMELVKNYYDVRLERCPQCEARLAYAREGTCPFDDSSCQDDDPCDQCITAEVEALIESTREETDQ